MLNTQEVRMIQPHMPVVCSNNGPFATVDHLESAETIKLARDDTGMHHYIPMSWVSFVDDKVHVDRPGRRAMREWMDTPPAASGAGNAGDMVNGRSNPNTSD